MIIASSKKRLLQYLSFKAITLTSFYKKTGIKRGFLDTDKLNSTISDAFLAKIIANYEDLNLIWLISNKGEMTRKHDDNINLSVVSEEAEPYHLRSNKIPLIPTKAFAGLSGGTISISERDIKERYTVPDFVDADFMIRIKGSSMYPKYNSGDVVACKMITNSKFIQWNKVHVIATTEQGVLIKRLKKGVTKNTLLAVSDNPSYDPFEIPQDEILNIALVTGVIRLE